MASRRERPTLAKWYLSAFVTILFVVPPMLLVWWFTGGPAGSHASIWWICVVVFVVFASVGVMYLPPPWNGGYEERGWRRGRTSHGAAERLLAARRSQLPPDRAADAQLLIESGFAAEAEDLVRREARPGEDRA